MSRSWVSTVELGLSIRKWYWYVPAAICVDACPIINYFYNLCMYIGMLINIFWLNFTSVSHLRIQMCTFHNNPTNNSWYANISKLFDTEKSKSKSWARWNVKVTWLTHYPTYVHPFTSIGPAFIKIWRIGYLTLTKATRNKKTSEKIFNQFWSMASGILLRSFLVIGWVFLTSSCKQAIFGNHLWRRVEDTGRSTSTFPQTYTFFVQNI